MSVVKKKIILFLMLTAIFIEGCTSIKTGNLTDSLLLNGDNNFVIYSPNKSNTYRTTEVHTKIDYHYETINLIDKTINNYELYEQRLDDLFREKKISKKDYFDNKEKVKNLKNEAKTKRTEAQKALNEWKNLLQTSSLNDERRNKFIANSIAFENQKRVAAEQNRQEKERLEAENRRIENERQRLAKKEAEINNRPIQLTESPPSKTLANGLVVGRNYCCNSDGNFLYCIRSETISQQELNEIKRQRDNNVYREENDRTLIRCLEQGEEVQLLGEKGGWFKVYDIQSQRTGYMSKKMGSRISLTSCD